MINLSQRMVALGTAKSEIREAFAFAQPGPRRWGRSRWMIFHRKSQCARPDTVKELVHQLMDSVDPVKLHGYTPAQGEASVRQALADRPQPPVRHSLHGRTHFYLTAGAAGALCCALSALGCPGDQFLTFAPYFPEYKVFVESAGAQLVAVPAGWRTFRLTLPPWRPPSPPR